jgi:hypothetical protein
MKIAIISDTHDNIETLKKTLNFIKKEKIKVVLHCGDVSDQNLLKEALSDYSGKIYLSKGNCDIGGFEKVPKIKVFEEYGEIKSGTKKIAFCHFPKIAESLAASGKYDVVFYGHTHKPWIVKTGNTILANPGNLAGVFYKATFAIYDIKTGNLELKILERI